MHTLSRFSPVPCLLVAAALAIVPARLAAAAPAPPAPAAGDYCAQNAERCKQAVDRAHKQNAGAAQRRPSSKTQSLIPPKQPS